MSKREAKKWLILIWLIKWEYYDNGNNNNNNNNKNNKKNKNVNDNDNENDNEKENVNEITKLTKNRFF